MRFLSSSIVLFLYISSVSAITETGRSQRPQRVDIRMSRRSETTNDNGPSHPPVVPHPPNTVIQASGAPSDSVSRRNAMYDYTVKMLKSEGLTIDDLRAAAIREAAYGATAL